MKIDVQSAWGLAHQTAMAAGADAPTAASLASATVAAEVAGHSSVGFSHLLDYVAGLKSGQIATGVMPEWHSPAPTTLCVDAKFGIAQLGFDQVFSPLVDAAQQYGVGLLLLRNSYTVGELGYYTRRLAEAGLLSLASTNGPALATTSESHTPVYGTNPFSFAAPVAGGRPLVIDQASTATAFVNIRQAASCNDPIPDHWALNTNGEPTTDAREALKGMLLTFGGARGANIALMVEVLAAGMTGANWSLDAPSFESGDASPGAGLFIIALSPAVLAPELPQRLATQLVRLADKGIYIPGQAPMSETIELSEALMRRLQEG